MRPSGFNKELLIAAIETSPIRNIRGRETQNDDDDDDDSEVMGALYQLHVCDASAL